MKQITENTIWLHCKGKESIRVSNEESGDILESGEYGLKRDFEAKVDVTDTDVGDTKEDEQELDLEELELDELKELAKEAGIKGFGNMKRETLISKLLEEQDNDE